jgi:hypothetical protein
VGTTTRGSRTLSPAAIMVDGWDAVGTVTARGDSAYELVAPTLADSNASGFHRATFFVSAETSTPSAYYDSAPDSGYSVDNLPPAIPAPFLGVYAGGAMHLHWGVNSEPDLWYYAVYRGGSASFIPGPGNRIATRSDTGYTDVAPTGSYYKLSAIDVDGNESGYALVAPGSMVDVAPDAPRALALEIVGSNPSYGGPVAVAFDLPTPADARLELIDIGGRRMLARDVGSLGAGRHELALAADRRLAAGLYMLRLSQGGETRTRRLVVIP